MDDRKIKATILEIVEYITFNLDAVTPQTVQHHLKKRYNIELTYEEVKNELNQLVSLNLLKKDTSYKIK